MSKPAKPAAAVPAAPAAGEAAPVKSKKKLIIGIVLVLAIAGGAGWYFTKGSAPADEHAAEAPKPAPMAEPKYVPLGEKFTVNLQREEGDQYLQVGIALKVLDLESETKIKAAMLEIRSKLLLLLSSKKPSELVSIEGKQVLVQQVIAEVDGILGFPVEVPAVQAAAAPAPHGDTEHAASAPAEAAPAAPKAPKTTGVVDVLFSDFIIQ